MKGNEKERRQQRRREDEKEKQQTRSQKKGSLDNTAGGPAGRHYLQCCLNHLLTFLYPNTCQQADMWRKERHAHKEAKREKKRGILEETRQRCKAETQERTELCRREQKAASYISNYLTARKLVMQFLLYKCDFLLNVTIIRLFVLQMYALQSHRKPIHDNRTELCRKKGIFCPQRLFTV